VSSNTKGSKYKKGSEGFGEEGVDIGTASAVAGSSLGDD